MEHTRVLPDTSRRDVAELVSTVTDIDGTAPLNEEAHLLLGREGALHWLLRDGDALVGYAQWQPGNHTGQLCVHPEHRRRGHGTALYGAITQVSDEVAVWAFGDLPAASAWASTLGLYPVRGLHLMERPLTDATDPAPRDGVTLRGFTDADAEAFLALNADAFAGHPEQGHFSADDLAHRRAEPWWDPDGLLVAEDADGLVGFHWTKRHHGDVGEVYVLGVHPRAAGQGLGTLLLDAGLAHLSRRGAQRVILYVDAGNAPAVGLYERSGFTVAHTDTLYAPAPVAG